MYKCPECGFDSYEPMDDCPMCNGPMTESAEGLYEQGGETEEAEL